MTGERSSAGFGAKVRDLDIAWNDRLKDADALYDAFRYSSAIAMAIYAVEIRLKVKICHHLELKELPKAFKTHDLDGLLVFAGLHRRLNSRSEQSRRVKESWKILLRYSKELDTMRYLPDDHFSQQQADSVLASLRDSSKGVLPWISIQL